MKSLLITIALITILTSHISATEKKETKRLNMYACGVVRVSFIPELNKAFSKKNNVNISVNKRGGDVFVIEGVEKKEADIGVGCRAPLKNDKEKDIWSTQVAWGSLAFIVNSKNKINNITTENIKKILTGKITNWKELGGEDKPIKLLLRESKKSGVGLTAREILFNDKDKNLSKKADFFKSSGFIRDAVVKEKYAFAIDDVVSSEDVKGLKLLKVDGVEPNKENILSGKYKARRAFYIYLDHKPDNLAKKYIDFALSNEGQAIISKTGTANLEEATGDGDEDNLIFQNLQFKIQTKN